MSDNLHRIMGAKFQHTKPNLCPNCKFRLPHGDWEGFCTARGKVLSAPIHKSGKCDDYQQEAAKTDDDAT